MDFYYIDNSCDTKEIGCFPQSTKMGCGYNHQSSNSIDKIAINKIPHFTPDTGCFVLQDKAKTTDFISASIISNGFILSLKTKKILEKFNLGKHCFFKTKISTNNEVNDNFFWLIFEPEDLGKYIDYKKTSFYLTDNDGFKIKEVKISSYIELQKIRMSINIGVEKIDSDSLSFNTSFPKVDLIQAPVFNYSTYVSEKLANELMKEDITGLTLKKSDWFCIPV